MCAANEPIMEESNVWHPGSYSTGGSTLIGDKPVISPLISPVASPTPWKDQSSRPVILKGPDNKQWIDLDILSPKLVKELRRQSAWPSQENSSSFAKGAAKFKAWARQNKLGIDIRLRRKVNEKYDEVTEFKLVPDFVYSGGDSGNQDALKLPSVAELSEDAVHEMPDTAVTNELSAVAFEPPSRTSTTSTFSEYLPRYESLSEARGAAGAESTSGDQPSQFSQAQPASIEAPEPAAEVDVSMDLGRPPSPASSIVRTPIRGLSVSVPASHGSDHDDHSPQEEKSRADELQSAPTPSDERVEALEAGLVEANRRLEEERVAREKFIYLIEDMRRKVPTTDADGNDAVESNTPTERQIGAGDGGAERTGSLLRGFRVADQKTFETETDIEPASSALSTRAPSFSTAKGKRVKVSPKRKKKSPGSTSMETLAQKPSLGKQASDSDGETPLLRRQTVPGKMTTASDPEDVWYALLTAQKKLLGPEHPLVFQVMHGFAMSRVEQHKSSSEAVMGGLRASKKEASRTLGEVHPTVTSYAEHVNLLELLINTRAGNRSARTPNDQEEPASDAAVTSEPKSPDTTSFPHDVPLADKDPPDELEGTDNDKREATAKIDADFDPQQQRHLSPLQTTLPPSSKDPTPPPDVMNPWYNACRPPHHPQNDAVVLCGLVLAASTKIVINAAAWVLRNYGPEPAVEPGRVRVRWTCSCGMNMHDDFVEKRRGAARELEAYLNRPRTHGNDGSSPISATSTPPSRVFTGSTGRTPTTQTTLSGYGPGQYSPVDTKGPRYGVNYAGLPQWQTPPEPPWLLTCANENRYTPKLAHLDMSRHKITSDRDLAVALRSHYFLINGNGTWWRALKLRGLTTIEFVQFEVHQNKYADIRKCPDMPPIGSSEYDFEPSELLPPVGSNYLLHLFKHPEDYDGELITYLRSPKKHGGRLQLGVGWGIHLVEGFLPSRVWLLMGGLFALGSLVFGVVWACRQQDVQGAFGVAAWMVTVAGLGMGYLQACLG